MRSRRGYLTALVDYYQRVAELTVRSRTTSSSLTRTNGSVRADDVRDAALTLFAARGYHGTSMKDIAAALGLQAPSLYNHVESKQSLLQEIMLGSMQRLVREQQAVLATTKDVTEQLRRAMEGARPLSHAVPTSKSGSATTRSRASRNQPAPASSICVVGTPGPGSALSNAASRRGASRRRHHACLPSQ